MGETDLSLQKNKHLLHQEDELQQDGSSPAGHPAEPPFTLKTLPGRGIGAVAKRMIPAGTLVLKEQATLTLQDPSTFYTGREYFQSLVSAYVNLPATSGQAILGLSAYTHPDDESTMRKHLASYSGNLKESQIDSICKLYSILTTNCFEGATSSLSSLYLKASRFNHSCLPNCTYTVASEDGVTSITVFSRQDVQSGEELTVPYLWIFHPREERQAKTLGIWGFVCGCPACDTTNPSVDTAAHEQRLEVYRRLERDSCLTMQMHACEVPLSMEDYDEALGRSIQRAEIVDSIGESDVLVREYYTSAAICEAKWLLDGNEKHVQRQINFWELGRAAFSRVPPSVQDHQKNLVLKTWLSAPKASPGTEGRTHLLEQGYLLRPGDKHVTARLLLKAKDFGFADHEDFLAGIVPLEELPAEIRALVAASGYSLEEILSVARAEQQNGLVES